MTLAWYCLTRVWLSGQAPACKAVYTGSNPVTRSMWSVRAGKRCGASRPEQTYALGVSVGAGVPSNGTVWWLFRRCAANTQ